MRTTAIAPGKTKGMFGWRMRLLLATVLAGITGLIWLQGLGSVGAQEAEVTLQPYVTVVVADDLSDPDNPGSSLDITFYPNYPPNYTCTRGDFNAYVSNWLDDFSGIPKRHLGSAATDDTHQITSTISNLAGEGLVFDVEVFCGTDTTGLLVSWAKVPHDKSSTSTESNRRLVPGTYSSEPPLTSLTVSSGTLSPTFHSHTFTYTAPDLTNAENRVTITTTAKPSYSITFIKFVTAYSGELHCPWASGVCTVTWRDSSNNVVDFLTDADPDTDGFQIDLDVGETKIVMDVYEGGIGTGNSRGYGVTVTRAPNTPATGAPTISGTAQVGETLTADTSSISDEDGLDDATFSYQWIANDGTSDADISGATGTTYALTDAEEGNAIKVKVSFTDDAGNEESLTSAATAAVAAANTAATGAPTISGTAQVGETLTAETSGIADPDGLTNVSYGYQWLSSRDTEIDGATSSTYTIPASDEGKVITVRVSFTDDAGNEESLTSAATAAVAAAALTPLTASIHSEPASHDGQAEFTFELRFSENLEGFSYSTLQNHAFTVNAGEVVKARRLESGKNIRWEITINPASSADVTIVLPITTDCSANGAVCTGDGRKLSNRLALTVSGPTDQENSAATGSPTISGTVQVGQTLTSLTTGIADTDGLTNASYSYQWVRNNGTSDSDIADATANTYALVDEDEGKTIKVQVTFTDDAGNEETLTSTASASVAGVPEPITVILENNPASHNGIDEFTFQIRFSEHFKLSYKTLRDHAFTVVGGTVKKAQRQVKGSNIGWTITVEPASNAEVEIVLPATTDCGATGAICTADGRKLSNSLDFTVVGPGE